MSITKLPGEVLFEIFQHLGPEKKQLYECANVCKAWHLSAIQLFCKNILLRHEPHKVWERIVYDNKDNIGNWVQTLTIQLQSVRLTEEQYLCILNRMPYLRVIDLKWSVETSGLFTRLVKSNRLQLNYLEEIVYCKWADKSIQYVDHFICAYHFRNSLKCLDVGFLGFGHSLGGKSGSAIDFLKEFKQLKYLSIDNKISSGGTSNLNMFQALSLCPKLISLAINNQFTETTDQSVLIEPHANLKNFNAKLLRFNSIHAQYVSKNFPKNLNTFYLKLLQTSAYNWVDENDELVMQEFGQYLSVVEEIKIEISEFIPAHGLLYFGSQSHLTVSYYWGFINSLMSNNTTSHCHLSVTVKDLLSDRIYAGIAIRKNKNNLTIEYSLDTTRLSERLDLFTPGLPHCNSKFTTERINSIQVVIMTPMISFGQCLDFLELMIPMYPRLKFLMISYWYFNVEGEYILKFASKPNLFAWELPDYEVDPYFDFQPLKFNTTTTETEENLKYALMQNATLVPSDVKRIGYLLPHTKVFKIIAIEYLTHPHLVLDLNGIHSLKSLILDFRFLGKLRSTYFQIEKGQEISCYKISIDESSFCIKAICPPNLKQQSVLFIHLKCKSIDKISFYKYNQHLSTI